MQNIYNVSKWEIITLLILQNRLNSKENVGIIVECRTQLILR